MKTQKGFTLIELLVVIAIIGILASIVLASLQSARQKGRDARRIADIKEMQNALALYYNDNSEAYPATAASIAPTFIPALPVDPQGAAYLYAGLTDGVGSECVSYHIGATLEQASNEALSRDADPAALGTECTGSGADFDPADPIYDVMP